VAGNHDLIAVEELTTERCSPLARRSLEWTRSTLGTEARATLRALPATASTAGGVLIAHGSVVDPQEYVRTAAQARNQLELVPEARIVVLGHTHVAAVVGSQRRLSAGMTGEVPLASEERFVLNPGSVGQSRQRLPRARFAILDLERGSVTFHALRYDTRACRAALRREGLPERSYHQPPRRLRGYATGAIRRARKKVTLER
jgi:diadenosine tetraphosphatase ApaH/serine/threonine PP2A family protein phosphatase